MATHQPSTLELGWTSQITGTPSTAAQTVLAIPELINEILCYLSPSTLLLSATKVCKAWHEVISSPSPSLQVTLFLQPATRAQYGTHREILFNDTLLQLLPGHSNDSPNVNLHKGIDISTLPWKTKPEAWNHPNAIWRKMLLSQPSCTKLNVGKTLYSSRTFPRIAGTSKILSCEEGVTAGLLYDIIEDCIDSSKDPKIERDRLRLDFLRDNGYGWDRKILTFSDDERKTTGFWISLKMLNEVAKLEAEREESEVKEGEVLERQSLWKWVRKRIGF